MATITLTEFNRNPSRVAWLARTEDVILTDHGVATLELRAIGKPASRLDELRRAGLVSPARDRSRTPIPDAALKPGLSQRLYAAYEDERDRREY